MKYKIGDFVWLDNECAEIVDTDGDYLLLTGAGNWVTVVLSTRVEPFNEDE